MIDAILPIALAASGGFLIGWWTRERHTPPVGTQGGGRDVAAGRGLSPQTVRHHYGATPAAPPPQSAQLMQPRRAHEGQQDQRS